MVDFKSAASAVPPRGQRPDSTEETAILEAFHAKDWKRLGDLLGAAEPELARIVAAWAALGKEARHALAATADALSVGVSTKEARQ